ncbi:MAG: DinB family protein [Acidobacteriota bacterium]
MALRAEKVSQWSAGWHVEHLSMTAALIVDYLEKFLEVGGESGWKGPNWVGWMVLLSRFIPRGAADVPDFLDPEGIDIEALRRQLDDTARRLRALEVHLDKLSAIKGTQQHPLLGHFTVKQWFDFLVIHDHHHYKIIRDIERAVSGAPK